ncbi:hypothetical protein EZJ07_20055 [Klebsiella pneumoniae]|nr:hypothetical protein EZJ07_20055 [Klebsiella pneumoniae]
MAQKRIDGKDGRNHTLDLTFWQFAIQLILLIKSTDNKDGHLCKFTQILQLPQNTKGGIARC